MLNPENFHFFIPYDGSKFDYDLILFVSNHLCGGYFKNDAKLYGENLSFGYALKNIYPADYKEINIKEAISLILPEYRDEFCKILHLRENIKITDAQKQEIINYLIKHRAFNDDSALEVTKDSEPFLELESQGIIHCSKIDRNSFYVKR